MHTAYLLTGGNLGNRQALLQQATQLIESKAGKLAAVSPIYETEPWGISDQGNFLNQVLVIRTRYSAAELMSLLLSIEEEMGRMRLEKFGARIIDIDILFFDNETHQSAHITIPHPEISRRRFALVPMAVLAPQLIHPVLQKNMQQLLTACPDPLVVKKI